MMMRHICYSLLCILLWTNVAPAQIKFELKFPEETKFVDNRQTTTTQTLTLAGMDIDTKSTSTSRKSTEIGKRNAEGHISLQVKTESIQADISLPGGLSLSFDSANPDKKAPVPQLEPILDLMRAAARLPITVERDAKNQIVSVKLPEFEAERLPEAAKERMNPATLQKEFEISESMLPKEPVKPGHHWEHASEANLGSGQMMSFRTNYEYVGTIDKEGTKLEKISGNTFDVNFTINGNPALQVTKSDLKVISSEITILFDKERGAVVSDTSKIQIAGPITLVINNMELPGKVDLTIEDNTSRQK